MFYGMYFFSLFFVIDKFENRNWSVGLNNILNFCFRIYSLI